MSPTNFISPKIFNPGSQSSDDLVDNFVIRLREFEELLAAIKRDNMSVPPQHFMIQGQRGYGKTTLLLRLNIEIKNDPDLRPWLIPLLFDEEQYSVRTLAKLWAVVIDTLSSGYSDFAGLSELVDPLYDKKHPEEEIFNLLLMWLKDKNKKLVLLIDNFGDIIEKFTRTENQRLREVLNTCSQLRIIGASSRVPEVLPPLQGAALRLLQGCYSR
ncbi:MAG: ATP-binding protein [Ignavibacteriae bacterium]|nr:ATP-binding protein [Ignavibacteriota bacterium]